MTDTSFNNLSHPNPQTTASIAHFWAIGDGFDDIHIRIDPPPQPLAILEKLGPSPFERGGFPLIGFLASTYERVSRFALGDTRPTESTGDEPPPAGSATDEMAPDDIDFA